MANRQVEIQNPTGLHARPAAEFCKLAARFTSDITVKKVGVDKEGNGKSVISLMTLGFNKGSVIEISAEGDDAQEAVDALAALIEEGFGEI
ncbi:MAG: HPr family phosphocarrier protein [Eubacteriaceae bacterium]|jgi:phosphotransferase system HPr (HPr) family protein|nr:HPr family phosphocarrier protein [Eubacteriaceae bacterium]